MRIQFRTDLGSEYIFDYTSSDSPTFQQLSPIQRTGPLYNSSPVLLKRRVTFYTKNETPVGDKTPVLRCIQTAVVSSRVVLLG